MWEKAEVSKNICNEEHRTVLQKKDMDIVFSRKNISIWLTYYKVGIHPIYYTPQPLSKLAKMW